MSIETEDHWRYWKAAISCLPTQETRGAAWEFFVRHFSQNPKMADILSGLILIMQANSAALTCERLKESGLQLGMNAFGQIRCVDFPPAAADCFVKPVECRYCSASGLSGLV